MRDYRGTLAGLVLGALGGFTAALFGALLGFLIDLIRAELRAHRLAIRFLESGDAPESFPRSFALACRLYASLRTPGGPAETPSTLVDRLRPLLDGPLPRRVVERIAATAAELPGRGEDRWAERLAACAPAEHRELVFRAVWEELQRSGEAQQVRESIHDLARRAALDEGFIARELVVRPTLDAEACRVLGVPRDASPHEIRAAYRRLAAQFHPDTAGGLTGAQLRATEEAFVRIRAAYEKLRERQS